MIATYKAGKLSSAQIGKLQQARLHKLVDYARKQSPYLAQLYANLPQNYTLCDLPATNKTELMAHYDQWLTDNAVTTARLNEFMSNTDNIGKLVDGKYLVFKTSGSTGKSARVLYDKNCIDVASAVAALRTFARKTDFKRFMRNGKRTAGVFADYGFYLACSMSRYLTLKYRKNNKINVDVNDDVATIIARLNEFKPSMLSGYPSNLVLLAQQDTLNIKPDVVLTGGELLTDGMRKLLERKFECYVQTHYSCTEAGEIACECEKGHLHINEDWVIVEAVDEQNRPVADNTLSAKILVTNLANYIQPFIRYEVSDRVIIHSQRCECGKVSRWLTIEGRTDDTLTFDGNVKIAPMSFYKIMEEIPQIQRFQLIQISQSKLELRLDANDKQRAFVIAERALREFLAANKVDNIEITLSNVTPRADEASGKYKHVFTKPNA